MSDWTTDQTLEDIARSFWERRGWNWDRTNPDQRVNLIRDIKDILNEGARRARDCPKTLPGFRDDQA